MTDVQEFCLRWNNHQSNLVSAFHDLRLGEDFVDVTLACDGKSLQAHRIVLSACSPFFRDILKTTPCNHPVIVLKDILFRDLVALIEFMYQGEVRVLHDGLPSFFRAAEVLRVRGLTEEALLRQEASRLAFEKLAGDSAENVDASMSHSSHLADHHSDIQLRQQQTLKASTPNDGTTTRSMDDVKVEEVDLDSTSEDEMEGENTASEHKETEVGPSEETLDRDGTEKEMDELPQPSLTLQSFARIPALVSVDLNPHSSQDFNSDFSVGSDDRRPAQELQGTMELDNPLGRTPGRTSTSDRPRWPCPFCLRLLSSRSSVRRHIEDRHTNDNSRHPCPLCERLYRTRNSLQYHLSTAHRDREPGPRGRPRTRTRTESATENSHSAEAKESASETDRLFANPAMMTMYRLSRGPQFGLPPT